MTERVHTQLGPTPPRALPRAEHRFTCLATDFVVWAQLHPWRAIGVALLAVPASQVIRALVVVLAPVSDVALDGTSIGYQVLAAAASIPQALPAAASFLFVLLALRGGKVMDLGRATLWVLALQPAALLICRLLSFPLASVVGESGGAALLVYSWTPSADGFTSALTFWALLRVLRRPERPVRGLAVFALIVGAVVAFFHVVLQGESRLAPFAILLGGHVGALALVALAALAVRLHRARTVGLVVACLLLVAGAAWINSLGIEPLGPLIWPAIAGWVLGLFLLTPFLQAADRVTAIPLDHPVNDPIVR